MKCKNPKAIEAIFCLNHVNQRMIANQFWIEGRTIGQLTVFRKRKHVIGELSATNKVIFEVTEVFEGGYTARALCHGIFTRGDDWNDQKEMVRDAVLSHNEEEDVPSVIRLHLVRDEFIAV